MHLFLDRSAELVPNGLDKEDFSFTIKHIQRVYPLKEINDKMKPKADALRNIMKKKCISLIMKNFTKVSILKI